jgi:hypothetical protein
MQKRDLKCMKKTFKDIKSRLETMKKSKLKKNIVFKRTVAHLLTKTAIKNIHQNQSRNYGQLGLSRKIINNQWIKLTSVLSNPVQMI